MVMSSWWWRASILHPGVVVWGVDTEVSHQGNSLMPAHIQAGNFHIFRLESFPGFKEGGLSTP